MFESNRSSEVETIKKKILSPGASTQMILESLIQIEENLVSKYPTINVAILLQDNCKTKSDVEKLIEGLDILSKYSRNLTQPVTYRPQNWKHISYNNEAFNKKVSWIKGHINILETLGYTIETRDGLVYVEESAPDAVTLLMIYLELQGIQLELKRWLDGNHPYPKLVEFFLPFTKDFLTRKGVSEDNHSKKIVSPNDTLTQENAQELSRVIKRTLRDKQKTGQGHQQHMPPRKVSPYECDALVMTEQPPLEPAKSKMASVYPSKERSSYPTKKSQESSIGHVGQKGVHTSPPIYTSSSSSLPVPFEAAPKWLCLWCTYANEHNEISCRRSSPPSSTISFSSSSFPSHSALLPHTCHVCQKTSSVPCSSTYLRSASHNELNYKDEKPIKISVQVSEQEREVNEEDFKSDMKEIHLKKEKEEKDIRKGRLLQLVKALESQYGITSDEEVHYLNSKIRSVPVVAPFTNALETVLDMWRLKVNAVADQLKNHEVFRDWKLPKSGPIVVSIKKCLVACDGDSSRAAKRFLKEWDDLVCQLEKECSVEKGTRWGYSNTLLHCGGSVEDAKVCLIKNLYFHGVWGGATAPANRSMDLYGDTRLWDPMVEAKIKDGSFKFEKRVRMLMCESDISDWNVAVKIISIIDATAKETANFRVANIVQEVLGGQSMSKSIKECVLCCERKPLHLFVKLPQCTCSLCVDCVVTYFKICIKENPVTSLFCPHCSLPKIGDNFSDHAYFQELLVLLTKYLDDDLKTSLEEKLVMWGIKNEKMVYCPWNCNGQFTVETTARIVTCPSCGRFLCCNCSKKWLNKNHQCEEDHILMNDTNCVECPKCKEQFQLVRGGCLHLKCTRCLYEFCCECGEAFKRDDCTLYASCKKAGFHCHHQRNCFSDLRDKDIIELQHLLKMHKIPFSTSQSAASQLPFRSLPQAVATSPELGVIPVIKRSQSTIYKCQVMVQKSEDEEEEVCGVNVLSQETGLCIEHYKEYLYKEIKMHMIDPVHIMEEAQMISLLKKHDLDFPSRRESEGDYRATLIQIIKSKLPLKRRDFKYPTAVQRSHEIASSSQSPYQVDSPMRLISPLSSERMFDRNVPSLSAQFASSNAVVRTSPRDMMDSSGSRFDNRLIPRSVGSTESSRCEETNRGEFSDLNGQSGSNYSEITSNSSEYQAESSLGVLPTPRNVSVQPVGVFKRLLIRDEGKD